MPRMLDGELFQSPDVDPELLVKIITLRPRTKRPLSSTSPPPSTGRASPPPAPKKGETPPVRIALPVEVARPTSPRPDLLTPNEIIILQHILTQAGGNAQKFPKPITQTAPGIHAEKDIRKRAADLEKMLRELSLVEPILSACARDLVGDLEEVRKYAKGITMPPIKDGFKDDPTGRYYQGLLDVPFPMDNLGRLIANHNRLMCSSVYTSFEPGPKPQVAPIAREPVNRSPAEITQHIKDFVRRRRQHVEFVKDIVYKSKEIIVDTKQETKAFQEDFNKYAARPANLAESDLYYAEWKKALATPYSAPKYTPRVSRHVVMSTKK